MFHQATKDHSTKNPASTPTIDREKIISGINEYILGIGDPFPDSFLPISREVYFTPFENFFPTESKVHSFLGQILMEENTFLDTFTNKAIPEKIKKLKRKYKITEGDCGRYSFMRRSFHTRFVLTIYKRVPRSFFAELGELMKVPLIISEHTQISSNDYRNAFYADEADLELFMKFKEMHLMTFINWINENPH